MKQEIMTVEEIVKEVTLSLSNVFINKLKEKGRKCLTPDEVIKLYVSALEDTAKAYQSAHNNSSNLQ